MTTRALLVLLSISISACGGELLGGGAGDLGGAPPTGSPDLAGGPPPTGGSDGGVVDPMTPGAPDGPALYPAGARHSPVTARVAARWQAIVGAKSRSPKSFVRLGDNLSHEVHLLGCADRASTLTLGAFSSLSPTVDWFRGGSINGASPFAYVRDLENMSTDAALEGAPNLVAQEIAAGNPAFALVMFGSLDLGWAGEWQPSAATDGNVVDRFGPNLLEIVDQLIAEGVLPLVRTIAPVGKSNNGPWNRRQTLVNALTRAVAAGRAIPFADFAIDAAPLGPEAYWSDGLHLSAAPGGACVFTPDGMKYGDDAMGRIALEQLDRARRAALAKEVLDPTAATIPGDGTRARPYEIGAVPFGTMGDVNGAGGEVVYRLTVTATTRVRVLLFDAKRSPVATRLTHVVGGATRRSNATTLALELEPGVHDFVVGGGSAGGPRAEFGFAVDRCDTDVADCTPDR